MNHLIYGTYLNYRCFHQLSPLVSSRLGKLPFIQIVKTQILKTGVYLTLSLQKRKNSLWNTVMFR